MFEAALRQEEPASALYAAIRGLLAEGRGRLELRNALEAYRHQLAVQGRAEDVWTFVPSWTEGDEEDG